jgi:serum/glucocorticoid-regulated kinase 2
MNYSSLPRTNSISKTVEQKNLQTSQSVRQIPSHNLPNALHEGCKKKVTVLLDAGLEKLDICIEGEDKTVYWLLKEVISRYSQIVDQHKLQCQRNNQRSRFKKHLIAAVKSTSGNESLDYFLTLYDRSLSKLPSNLTLEVYFSRIMDKQNQKITNTSFQPLKVIGRGGFSKVFLVRKKDSGLLFAMKVMEKDFIRQDGKFKQVMCERKIMEELDHPFIVKLHYAF